MQSNSPTFNNFAIQSEDHRGLHVAIIMDGNGRWLLGAVFPAWPVIVPEWPP